MKIMICGLFAEHTGYGRATRDLLEVFDKTGHEITIYNLNYASALLPEYKNRIETQLTHDGYDIGIVVKPPDVGENLTAQNPLNKCEKLIYYTMFETTRWPNEWEAILTKYDEIWTPTEYCKNGAGHLGINTKVLPLPVRALERAEKTKGVPFIFYSEISRVSDRKNLIALLRAYYASFTNAHNVILRVKISTHERDIKTFLGTVARAKREFAYRGDSLPKIEYIHLFLTDDEMDGLVIASDCYVAASKGEGFGLTLSQAYISGIPCVWPIAKEPWFWGMDRGPENKHKYEALRMEDVFTDEYYDVGMRLDTSRMTWAAPDPAEIGIDMRGIYEKSTNECYIPKDAGKVHPDTILKNIQDLLNG